MLMKDAKIKIYTTPSCTSCRKTKRWFEDHKLDYEEKSIGFSGIIPFEEIQNMLRIAKKDYIMSLDNPESYNPNVFVNLEIRKDIPKTPEDEVFEETIQCLDLIISSRTNVFKKFELKLNEIYKTKDINQLVQFINDFPSILKRPIILEEETEKIQIGFNEEDIRDFLPQNINDAVYKHFMGMEWKSNLTKEELDVVEKLIKSTFKTKNRKQAKRKKSYDNFDVEMVDDDYEEDDDSDEE